MFRVRVKKMTNQLPRSHETVKRLRAYQLSDTPPYKVRTIRLADSDRFA
jgi:hypothetical protein